jgi:hypothetical protein
VISAKGALSSQAGDIAPGIDSCESQALKARFSPAPERDRIALVGIHHIEGSDSRFQRW